MVYTQRTQTVGVYHKRGNPMSLSEIEEFCRQARAAGFGDSDQPWVGDGLIHSMSLSNSEPRDDE